jgi:exopolysaccharide transport family protein
MNVQSRVQDEALLVNSGSQRHQPPPASSRMSLIEVWQILRMRHRVFIGAAGAMFLGIMLIAIALPQLFTGTATVMLDTRQNNTVSVQQVLSGLTTDQTTILNQIQILQSRELASRVVDKLHLDQDGEFLSPTTIEEATQFIQLLNPLHYIRASITDQLSPEQKRELLRKRVVDKLLSRLSVAQVQLSTAIQIDCQSENPVKAALIANTYAEAYVEDQLNAKLEATQSATRWISSRLGKLAEDARIAEATLEQYKAANHLTDVATQSGTGTISVLDQQIGAATQQLMQAQMDRAQAEATLSRVRSLVASGHAADVSSVVNSPLIASLREQEATLVQQQAQLASRYGPEHPKMLDLLAEKRDLEAKINTEIEHVVQTSANDVAVAAARESALESSLHQFEGMSNVQGVARVKERELEATATSTRALYDSFVARVKQTEQEETLQIPDARVISRADIPVRASFPPMLLVFSAAVPIALIFGFVIVFMLEGLDHGFRTAARVEQVLGLPVLSTLPEGSAGRAGSKRAGKDESGEQRVVDEIVDRPLSSFAEAVRGLQMGLSLYNVDHAPKVVLVTSAVPGEGKTTTALSLARHIAMTGQKVILVDGDLRRPTVRNIPGANLDGFDIVDVLQGSCTLDKAIAQDPRTPLAVLPALKHVKNAPDLLDSQAMRNIITQLRGVFDMVIIDSAPILPVNDTKILTRLADAVLFIVRWENTPRDASADAVKALREIGAPLAGVALARADTKRLHYYSFGYGDYYYSYSKYYES